MNKMNKFESYSGFLTWFMALLLVALAAGCGGGKDPILGTGAGAAAAAAAGAGVLTVVPGLATCAAALVDPATIPRVISSDPTSGNLNATTSTTDPVTGLPGANKLITATFSLAMNPATITPAPIFTLRNNTTSSPVAGTVTMSGASIANTIATFTTPTLAAGNSYTATILQTAATPGGITLACIYAWTFTTVAIPPSGLSPVNMGTAAPFGISANAGLVTAVSISTVNADVLLDPGAFCNGAPNPVDGAGGIGSCGTIFPPIINGTVISPLFTGGRDLATINADLNAAFLSITPPAGPPAAGSLGGATAIAAGTTLGDVAGNPFVPGDNYFTPGVYQSITSILITGDLTLDALGNPDAVFVFQSSSTVGTAAGAAPPGVRTRILLIGGAKASNVWWQAGTDAVLGLFSEFQGNILVARDVTMNNGATSCGRVMAGAWVGTGPGSGAFTLGGANVLSVPGQPFAPPAGYSTTCQ